LDEGEQGELLWGRLHHVGRFSREKMACHQRSDMIGSALD